KLMTLGYGFSDPHINDAIAKAAVVSGLELHIWDTRSPADMRTHLMGLPNGPLIWDAMRGYTPESVRAVFPDDDSRTETWRQLGERFFGSPVPRDFPKY
ncbi:MAG TPA: hypothetical protein VKT78_15845, partial [Fimbriimonadaceae bacterium]|nr:hypothetical protein [Fimbriimonadaceae bacterium]